MSKTLVQSILFSQTGGRRFQNSTTIETGLSDHHKLTITVMKSLFQKQVPITISYRDYKHFNHDLFRNELLRALYNRTNTKINYDIFEEIIVRLLNKHAPLKKRFARANNSPFMNKALSKAVMTRSRLRNKFVKNQVTYTRYRNYCTGLFRKERKKFYNNLDTKLVTDHFGKPLSPPFLISTSVITKLPCLRVRKLFPMINK